MTPVVSTGTCWDLAVSLAAHHRSGTALNAERVHHDIFQVGAMRALLAGDYDGVTEYAEVMRHGDFGVGTFNALDGEMAALDGHYYHLHSDGSVTRVDPRERTPFAVVAFFRADAEIDVESPCTRGDLLELIDRTVPGTDTFYAIRIEGSFRVVTTRTAARQSKPYPRLVETTGSQVEHAFTSVRGTMVGFRAPQYAPGGAGDSGERRESERGSATMTGTTVPGYHLHFLDETRTIGGHVLDFALEAGVVTIDHDTDLHVEIPATESVSCAPISAQLAAEIEQIENQSHGG